jgi:hypothetical protein
VPRGTLSSAHEPVSVEEVDARRKRPRDLREHAERSVGLEVSAEDVALVRRVVVDSIDEEERGAVARRGALGHRRRRVAGDLPRVERAVRVEARDVDLVELGEAAVVRVVASDDDDV